MGGIVTAYWTSWKVRAGVAITGLFALGSILVAANSAFDDATSIWQKMEIIYSYAATPWVGLCMFIAVVVLTTWGIRDVIAAQARGNLLDQEMDRRNSEAIAASNAETRRVLEIPLMVMRAYLHSREYEALLQAIERSEAKLNHHEKLMAPWLSDEGFDLIQHHEGPHSATSMFNADTSLGFEAKSFGVPSWAPSFVRVAGEITVTPIPNRRSARRFDPLLNRPYQQAERSNITMVRHRIAELQAIAKREDERRLHLEREIREAMQKYGYELP